MGGNFDTSQPGVRQLQAWIRDHTPLAVTLMDGSRIDAQPCWVDGDYLALTLETAPGPQLVSHHAIASLRPLP
jgi:host factor-I protein